MQSDPLSNILGLVDAQSVISGELSAGGAWSVRFPPPSQIKFFGVTTGECWLIPERGGERLRLRQGDVFLLAAAAPFVLTSDPSLPPVEALSLFRRGDKSGAIGQTRDLVLLCGHVELDPHNASLLTEILPPLIHISASDGAAADLHWVLRRLVRERMEEQPGAGLAAIQLGQLLLLQILRRHLETASHIPEGWLRLLRDPRLAIVLQAMQKNPGHDWRLEDLSKLAGMSRTSFTEHFKAAAGIAPLGFLTDWRMRLAKRALSRDNTPLTELSEALGYASESAFSNAFKRVVGLSPRHFREKTVLPESA